VRTQINCNKDWLKTPEQHTQNAVIIGIWRLRVCAWAERGAEKESGESAAAKEKEINLVAKANGEKFRNKFQLGLSEWVSFADGKVKSGGNIIVLCASSVTCAGAKLAEAKITKTCKRTRFEWNSATNYHLKTSSFGSVPSVSWKHRCWLNSRSTDSIA